MYLLWVESEESLKFRALTRVKFGEGVVKVPFGLTVDGVRKVDAYLGVGKKFFPIIWALWARVFRMSGAPSLEAKTPKISCMALILVPGLFARKVEERVAVISPWMISHCLPVLQLEVLTCWWAVAADSLFSSMDMQFLVCERIFSVSRAFAPHPRSRFRSESCVLSLIAFE